MLFVNSSKQSQRETLTVETDGFGLVEALIAGVILLIVMTTIGRVTQAAMTSGSNQYIRNKIENKIIDNMQKIQQQDSRSPGRPSKSLARTDSMQQWQNI